jgi:RHS repeat-associated protein
VYRGANTALTHRRLVYDAFGRLVRAASVEGMDETDVALYRYNGLNMRLMWQDDADADSSLESSERFYVMHDERWRPVATFRDTDSTPKEAFVWHAAGSGGAALGGTALQSGGSAGFGGASYIDSLILRDRDDYTGGTPNPMTSASDGTLEERRYFCQNWRADVVAVTKSDGTPIEYVRYSAYGEPTVYPVADLNMDGVVNSTDSSLWSDLLYSTSNASVYADTDLDWDGQADWDSGGADGDLFYESYSANTGLSGVGRVSSPGVASRTGYAGYQWDQTLGAYHIRYRVYLPDIGRWTRRDPLGYVDGMGLYEIVRARAVALLDPLGLASRDCQGVAYRDQCEDCCRANSRGTGMGVIRVFDECMSSCRSKPDDPGVVNPWLTVDPYKSCLEGGWDGLVCWCQGAGETAIDGSLVSLLIWGLDGPDLPCDWALTDPTDPNLDWSRLSGRVSCVCLEMAGGTGFGRAFRLEKGAFKLPRGPKGVMKSRWHFHLGRNSRGLGKWHLPYEWEPWYHHCWNNFRRGRRGL